MMTPTPVGPLQQRLWQISSAQKNEAERKLLQGLLGVGFQVHNVASLLGLGGTLAPMRRHCCHEKHSGTLGIIEVIPHWAQQSLTSPRHCKDAAHSNSSGQHAYYVALYGHRHLCNGVDTSWPCPGRVCPVRPHLAATDGLPNLT